jgi:hypothetical protein
MLLPGGELANARKRIIGKYVITDAVDMVDLRAIGSAVSYITPTYLVDKLENQDYIAYINEISSQSSIAFALPQSINDFITHC